MMNLLVIKFDGFDGEVWYSEVLNCDVGGMFRYGWVFVLK